MKLDEIEAFTTFVKVQSTSQAASELGITQPALSRRIQNLEQSVGLQLFDRNTRPLKLTNIGLAFYEQCLAVHIEVEKLNRLVIQHNQDVVKIRLGLANSLTDIALAEIIGQLKQFNPFVDIDIQAGWGKHLIQQLQQGDLDGIVSISDIKQQQPDDLQFTALAKLTVVPVVAKKWAKQNLKSDQDFQQYGWILNANGCGLRANLFDHYQLNKQQPVIKFEVVGSTLQMGLIAQGLGVGLLVKEMVKSSPYRDELHCIQESEIEFNVQYVFAHRHDQDAQKSACIEQFARLMLQKFDMN